MSEPKIALFEGKKIRRQWDDEKELWYFSIIDVIQILTDSSIPRRYWSDLKIKLQKEGSQVYEKIVQLKMQAPDGKYYLTDVADTETMLRIVQSIPSPNAEPFKLWLAQVGYDRLEETADIEYPTFQLSSNSEKKTEKALEQLDQAVDASDFFKNLSLNAASQTYWNV